MTVGEVIQKIKDYSRKTTEFGKTVDENRDKILFDSGIEKDCTGIVLTAFASYEVIKRAAELGANLIIAHEGMFWNHGDDTSWLNDNQIYTKKKELLEQAQITVWRNFEHIIAGIPYGNNYVDGIVYGLIDSLELKENLDEKNIDNHCQGFYVTFTLPENVYTAKTISEEIMKKAGLNGIGIIGDLNTKIRKLYYSRHQFLGYIDKQVIEDMHTNEVDAIICGETVDYTVASYVRDCCMCGRPKAIINVGNFNICELGMKYALKWVPKALGETSVPSYYVSSGDTVSKYL